jgi:hypothetical protein
MFYRDFNPLFEPFLLYPPELIPRPGPQNTINYCGFIVMVVVMVVVGNL